MLALNLSEQFKNLRMKCKACAALGTALMFWFKHIKDSNATINEGYQAALESGDLEYAGYLLHIICIAIFSRGKYRSTARRNNRLFTIYSKGRKNQLSTDTFAGVANVGLEFNGPN